MNEQKRRRRKRIRAIGADQKLINNLWENRYKNISKHKLIMHNYFFSEQIHPDVIKYLRKDYKVELLQTRTSIKKLYNATQKNRKKKLADILQDKKAINDILEVIFLYI